jgi:hypothetical protein
MGGGDGNRTRVQGFAGPCLSHSATPPQELLRRRPTCRIAAPPSGRRDSNPRPSPWQGDALPTEPRPRSGPGTGPTGSLRRAYGTVADPGAHANSGSGVSVKKHRSERTVVTHAANPSRGPFGAANPSRGAPGIGKSRPARGDEPGSMTHKLPRTRRRCGRARPRRGVPGPHGGIGPGCLPCSAS